MLTNEQLEIALIKSGFFSNEPDGLIYGYMDNCNIRKYLSDLTYEINKIIEEGE